VLLLAGCRDGFLQQGVHFLGRRIVFQDLIRDRRNALAELGLVGGRQAVDSGVLGPVFFGLLGQGLAPADIG
jgi:hypothetical protein